MTWRWRGGWLWVGCLQYFAAEAIAAVGYRGGYSFRRNFISDLGAASCGQGGGCSPLHALMNASFLLQGVLIFAGAVVVWPLFPKGLAKLALALTAVSGLGVAVVGLAPEDFAAGWHYLGAAENLLLSNAGAALLGAALLRERPAPHAVGLLSVGLGLTGLAGLAARRAGLILGSAPAVSNGSLPIRFRSGSPAWAPGFSPAAAKWGDDRIGSNAPWTVSDTAAFAYFSAAAARRRCSASIRSSASRRACAFPMVPRLSFAGFAPCGAALPRISRLWRAAIPLARSCASRRRRATPFELVVGLALDLGRPGQGDKLKLGGGQEPGFQSVASVIWRPPIRRRPVRRESRSSSSPSAAL